MKIQSGNNQNFVAPSASPAKNANVSGASAEAVAPVTAPSVVTDERQAPEQNPPKVDREDLHARLTIEKDTDTGEYVYKTIDRETGKIIRQLPREKLLQVIVEKQGATGLVIDQKV
ncbi:hypothetical protein MNBD_ALPHA06-823 [hydrothermal vent metagenome]|uniref:Flagellar protein FlaG n=1 Tax=hydrothermal vent metagenome TaxID=652676 RepID=A0A3B0S927_9ZZZZ